MFTKPKWFISFLIAMILLNDISFVSASPPAKIVAGVVTNVVSTIFKWLWSLRTPVINTEKGTTSRSLMKFEAGYRVETVFDGSKVGIEPYSVEMSPTGELLILDSSNNNLYKISTPFSRSYSRPKLVAGSPEGYTGHVDGKLREARMYSPKAFTLDDSGNIYIADTMNMAIRKITDTGITTIAGGKWSHGGAHHMDGSNEDAKFSDDFDVTYVRSRCSLLVTDRGNQAIREIQLNDVDCSYEQPQVQDEQHEENLFLGGAVLVVAAFSGYMLALLKQRVQALFSTKRDPRMKMNNNHAIAPAYQRHPIVVKPTLMPPQDEYEEEDEGLFFSFGRLIINATSSIAEVLVGLLFLGLRKKKPRHHDLRHFQQLNRNPNHAWPMHNGYVIREEDELPGLEMRTPIVRKPYPEPQVIQSQACFEGRDAEFQQHPAKIKPQEVVQKEQQQQQQQQQSQQKQKQKQRNVESCKAKTSSEKGSEKSEIVFGAVQEQDGRREAMVIKAVDYNDPVYNQHNIRPRVNYMGYSAYSYS